MPAAAVTPAPIAYIKVVAVKKLVVGFQFSAGLLPVQIRAAKGPLDRWCQSRGLLTVGLYHRSGIGGARRFASAFAAVRGRPHFTDWGAFNRVSQPAGYVYFEQIRVLKAGAFSPEYHSME